MSYYTYSANIEASSHAKQISDGTQVIGIQAIDVYNKMPRTYRLGSTTYNCEFVKFTNKGKTGEYEITDKSFDEPSNKYDLTNLESLHTFIRDKEFLVELAKAQHESPNAILSKLEHFTKAEFAAIEWILNRNQSLLSDFGFKGIEITDGGDMRLHITFMNSNLLSFYYKQEHEFYKVSCEMEVSFNSYSEFSLILEKITMFMSTVIILAK